MFHPIIFALTHHLAPQEKAPVSDNTISTLSLAADIVAAFVSNNIIAPSEIGGLIRSVKTALDRPVGPVAEPAVQRPAHSLKQLVTADAIFCAECGKRFKMLKRHLRTDHDLTPHDYRAKWALQDDSPMVTPNYSASRSEIAKNFGLGHFGQGAKGRMPPSLPNKRNVVARAKLPQASNK